MRDRFFGGLPILVAVHIQVAGRGRIVSLRGHILGTKRLMRYAMNMKRRRRAPEYGTGRLIFDDGGFAFYCRAPEFAVSVGTAIRVWSVDGITCVDPHLATARCKI